MRSSGKGTAYGENLALVIVQIACSAIAVPGSHLRTPSRAESRGADRQQAAHSKGGRWCMPGGTMSLAADRGLQVTPVNRARNLEAP